MLLALLWHPDSLSTGRLDATAGGRETVWRRLGEAGIGVPPEAPPPDDDRPVKRVDVRFADLETIVRRLPHLLPHGSPFGFNSDGDRAWIVVGEDVDAEPLIREALRAAS